jgi:hypothetical protein
MRTGAKLIWLVLTLDSLAVSLQIKTCPLTAGKCDWE